MTKHPVMLYLSDDELRQLWALVAASPGALWEDSDEDGPYEQLLTFIGRLGIEAKL